MKYNTGPGSQPGARGAAHASGRPAAIAQPAGATFRRKGYRMAVFATAPKPARVGVSMLLRVHHCVDIGEKACKW